MHSNRILRLFLWCWTGSLLGAFLLGEAPVTHASIARKPVTLRSAEQNPVDRAFVADASATDTPVKKQQEWEPTHSKSLKLSYREALWLGLLEGVTEYLPVSSTGHLILLTHAMELYDQNSEKQPSALPPSDHQGKASPKNGDDGKQERETSPKQALDAYTVIIQIGAILAIVFLYHAQLLSIINGILGGEKTGRLLARNLIVAFLPVALVGLLLENFIETYLFSPTPILIGLVGGSFLIFYVEHRHGKTWRQENPQNKARKTSPSSNHGNELDSHDTVVFNPDQLSVLQSLLVGVMQCFSLWPGTSRSMTCIAGGYMVGLSPPKAAEFSFLLGLITLSAACGYKTIGDWNSIANHLQPGPSLLGIAIAGISAAITVKWLVHILSKYGMVWFAWYRIILAVVIAIFLYSS